MNVNDFISFDLKHVELVSRFTRKMSGAVCCEYSVGNLISWGPIYDMRIKPDGDRLWLYNARSHHLFFPLGMKLSVDELQKDVCGMSACGCETDVVNVPVEWVSENASQLAALADFNMDESSWDYIYTVESLASLVGSEYSAKRNLIHQFEKNNPSYVVSDLTPTKETLGEIENFLSVWKSSADNSAGELDEDLDALHRSFACWNTGVFSGITLHVSGSLAAFCVYSVPTTEMADIHFEKASHNIIGASQLINRETAIRLREKGVKLLNREQDLGVTGLRRAKRSYKPAMLLKTGLLTFKKHLTTG